MNSFRNSVDSLAKSSKSKFSETRERFQSQSSKNLDPSKKAPPPPPPGRSSFNHDRTPSAVSRNSFSSPSPPPPPPAAPPPLPRRQPSSAGGSPNPHPPVARRTVRQEDSSPSSSQPYLPASLSRSHSNASPSQQKIDWANLSHEDKLAFFALLDEYFEQRRGTGVVAASREESGQRARPLAAPKRAEEPASTPSPPPPPLPTWSRPKQTSVPQPVESDDDFTLSYPPPTTYGSGAQDLANYFSSQTHWDSAWYKSANSLPPPLQNTSIPGYMAAWETHGMKKTLYGGVIFADLSICWYSVSFSTTGNADPNDTRAVQRSAQYLLPPQPMSGAALVEAHETYGETIAGFAESYEGTGEYCARGECWDLANEALKYFEQFDYVAKPVPSTSCTHGHLIFSGKATSKQHQVGRWRGGDDRVRRGDIVQWRSAKVVFDHGGYATLGNPEHTAIIVADCVPEEVVEDGQMLSPGALGTLVVVEQSVGSPPIRASYDLKGFSEGEIWIYRPVGMVEYVGTVLEPRCPDGVSAYSI